MSFSPQSVSASGSITDARKKTDETVHRQQREEEVLEILEHPRARSTSDEVSTKMAFTAEALAPRELVKIIYKEVPMSLHDAVEKGVLQILRKLLHEGKVIRNKDGEKWQINQKAWL